MPFVLSRVTRFLRVTAQRRRRIDISVRITAKVLLGGACLLAAEGLCSGQGSGILCTHGEGQFSRVSKTDVAVIVDAQKDNGLATRACEAKLVWNKKEIQVARNAWQADVDVMDVDLGAGGPTVAFQVKRTDVAPSMTYAIYLLRDSPQLIRTISGGDLYSAADTDLDGRIEIWTGDADAANGFEGIPLADFDFAPTIVMRFEKRRLMDVSSEFESDYDRQIGEIRAQLDGRQLSEFKKSDGRFETIPPWETEKLHGLHATKMKVLEMVWAYLYSGREQEAWRILAEMWPEADVERIRTAIVKARAGGISNQVDGVLAGSATPEKIKHAEVYDLTAFPASVDSWAVSRARASEVQTASAEAALPKNVTMPEVISLSSLPFSDSEQVTLRSGVLVDLVIDAAGKVRSARLPRKEDEGSIGESLIRASGHWKFTPAMEFGHAVASHIRLTVSLDR